MKKRIITITILVLVLVLALFAFTACNNAETPLNENIVSNGDFENFDKDAGKFEGWSWTAKDTNSKYYRDGVGEEGDPDANQFLKINNSSGSYGYLKQSVKVDRKHIYKVTVDMKLTSVSKGSNSTYRGAYVTFSENTEYFFVEHKEVTDGWKTLTFYVKPIDTDYLTISLALGADNANSNGTVYYDNVTMSRVESVPSGFEVTEFRKASIARYQTNVGGVLFVVFLSLLTIALILTAYVLIRRNYANKNAFVDFGATARVNSKGKTTSAVSDGKWYTNVWFIAGMLALGTFIVRLIVMLTMYGFGSETTYTVGLARFLGTGNGVRKAYATYGSSFIYSPGSLYILAIMGAMGKNLGNEGLSVLIRLIGLLADIATVELIYFYGRKYAGNRLSTVYAGLYALLPVTFIMGGVSNTFESLLVALLLGSVILLVEKQYLPMYLVITLAAILEIRALALAPVFAGYLGYQYYKDDEKRFKPTKNRIIIAAGLIGSFVLAYILTIPVGIDQINSGQPFFNFTVMANQMLNNGIFVRNAFNLYGMVGMNMKITNSTVNILNLIFLLVLEIYAVSLYVKFRNKQEIFLLSSFVLAVVAVFTLKVNFTYLFLAIALGFVYTMISGDRRMYGIMGTYSVLAFLSVGQLMNNSGFVTSVSTGYFVNFESTSPDLIIFSIIAVLTTLYYAYVSYSIMNNGKIVDIKPMKEKFAVTAKNFFDGLGGKFKDIKLPEKKTVKSDK